MARFGFGGERPRAGTGSIFSEFEEMRREMQRMAEQTMRDIERLPKNLVREYQTPEGSKVREVGPIVYGYSVTIGPDGKPQVREFGNIRPPVAGATAPQLTAEREPLADVVTTDKEIKVLVEMPGVRKEDVKINAFDNSVDVFTSETAKRKYQRRIELPTDADTNTARSTYQNGILEITFNRKAKPKGKEIKVE